MPLLEGKVSLMTVGRPEALGVRIWGSIYDLRDDFLNIAIISEINRIIGDSGYHLTACDNLGMPNWVVALTREEEDRLRRERGWSFLAL